MIINKWNSLNCREDFLCWSILIVKLIAIAVWCGLPLVFATWYPASNTNEPMFVQVRPCPLFRETQINGLVRFTPHLLGGNMESTLGQQDCYERNHEQVNCNNRKFINNQCGPSKPQWESERVISMELCLSLVLHHLKIKIVYACLVHGYGIENLLLTSFCIVPRRNMISLNWKLEKTIYDIVLRCSIGHRSWKYLIWDVALRVQ